MTLKGIGCLFMSNCLLVDQMQDENQIPSYGIFVEISEWRLPKYGQRNALELRMLISHLLILEVLAAWKFLHLGQTLTWNSRPNMEPDRTWCRTWHGTHDRYSLEIPAWIKNIQLSSAISDSFSS